MKPTVPQRQPADLTLESLSEADPQLPKPRGKLGRNPPENAFERSKLEATKASGGLLPERLHQSHWACADCGRIFTSRDAAYFCHKLGANRIQTCGKCGRRITDCGCPPLSPIKKL